jgi:hypothetical protein
MPGPMTEGKNRIMIYGPKNDGTYGEGRVHFCPARSGRRPRSSESPTNSSTKLAAELVRVEMEGGRISANEMVSMVFLLLDRSRRPKRASTALLLVVARPSHLHSKGASRDYWFQKVLPFFAAQVAHLPPRNADRRNHSLRVSLSQG